MKSATPFECPQRRTEIGVPRRDEGPVVVLYAHGYHRHVLWGLPWHIGSAAYWISQVQGPQPGGTSQAADTRHALGRTLREELAACMLGGFGLPAAVGLAAFDAVRSAGLLDDDRDPQAGDLLAVLQEPVTVKGRQVRYRFAQQRSTRLAEALAGLRLIPTTDDATKLRQMLVELPGVGPKTASWIVRNHLGSDEVAIIDIHIRRAAVVAGIFEPSWTPERHYAQMEAMFLSWARTGKVSAADLDASIWSSMARLGRDADAVLGHKSGTPSFYARYQHVCCH